MFSLVRSGIAKCRSKHKKLAGRAIQDVNSTPQVLGHFGRMFLEPQHRSNKSAEELEDQIRCRAAVIEKEQPGYHPVYGFTAEFPAKRLGLLERNCVYVGQYLEHVQAKQQVRILDVGCNSGYASFRLAENFQNVVGLEIARDRLELCRDIAVHSDSSARFFDYDFVQLMENGEDDLDNVDVVLLLNVVHQFVFNYGLSYTQALIARLARRVDMVFVELARREQYVKHKKDHLLPENPEDIFKDCEDLEITLLEDKPRPLYVLRRKKMQISHFGIVPDRIEFSTNSDNQISRKYYANKNRFIKLYRHTERQDISRFHHEVEALLRMRDTGVAPVIHDWAATCDFGAVMMSNVPGPRLVQLIYRPQFNNSETRYKITRQYLYIAKSVYENIGFQNDMQTHNIIVTNQEKLILVDYEQTSHEPHNDPFGIFLWTMYDIWGGRTSTRPESIRSLRLVEKGVIRPTGAIYPDFSELEIDDTISALIDDARQYSQWGEFLAVWNERLGGRK